MHELNSPLSGGLHLWEVGMAWTDGRIVRDDE